MKANLQSKLSDCKILWKVPVQPKLKEKLHEKIIALGLLNCEDGLFVIKLVKMVESLTVLLEEWIRKIS